MNKIFIFLTVLFVNCSLLAQSIQINESEASVKFVFMDDDIVGSFSDFKFTVAVHLDDLTNANFSGSVAVETIDTNNWLRNGVLKRKYFKYKDFPRLSFKSTEVNGNGKEFLVRGTLTIKGVSKPVTLTFTKRSSSFYAGTTINAADFGIHMYDEKSRNMVQIMLNLPYTSN